MKIIKRAEWKARPPKKVQPASMTHGSTAHWEGTTIGFYPEAQAPSIVRAIQNYHLDAKDWFDIAYSFLIDRYGNIYEGRGLNVRTGAGGTNEANKTAYAICYIGGIGDPFTDEAKAAYAWLVDYLDKNGGAGPNFDGHRDWKATQCPGDDIYKWVHSGANVPAPGPAPIPTPRPPAGDYKDNGWFKNFHKTIQYGDGFGTPDPVVYHFQYHLGIKADGIFGRLTRNATTNFQAKHGLAVDGIVGPDTWAKVHPVIKPGSSGWGVWEVELSFNIKNPDKTFTAQTTAAIQAVQAQKHLPTDGIVGPKTWRSLM